MAYEDILFDIEDGVAILTLNRPDKMNAFSPAMRAGIIGALNEVGTDDSIRVLIITGAGRAFCSGADVGGFAARSSGWFEIGHVEGTGFHLGPVIRGLDKPVIAAINGPAVGGGFGLAMSCDIRIASEQARLAAGYVRMGLAVEWGVSHVLPRLVGSSRALEILMTGDFISAGDAERLGLVSRVVPPDQLMSAARQLGTKLAAQSAFSLRQIKRAVLRGLDSDYKSQIDYEAYVQSMCFQTADHREAVTAFMEKREPKFRGM